MTDNPKLYSEEPIPVEFEHGLENPMSLLADHSEDWLDEILFFQSEPGSGNMLADWQIKQAKALILSKVKAAVLEGRLSTVNSHCYLLLGAYDETKNYDLKIMANKFELEAKKLEAELEQSRGTE